MLNYIWLALVLLAVMIGGANGHLKEVTEGAFDGARTAVTIALGLIGIMALWLGVMRLAERAGLVQRLALLLRPVMSRLFPGVPNDHPAMGAMLMNMAANMLGLGNAATPLGLRAMRDLETLNPHPGTATNAMCTFLAINTSSVQLIPTTAIAILVAAGATDPTRIVGTSLLATFCAATVAITSVKLLEKLPWFRVRDDRVVAGIVDPVLSADVDNGLSAAGMTDPGYNKGLRPWGRMVLTLLAFFFLALFVRQVFPEALGLPSPRGRAFTKLLCPQCECALNPRHSYAAFLLYPLRRALRLEGLRRIRGRREGRFRRHSQDHSFSRYDARRDRNVQRRGWD